MTIDRATLLSQRPLSPHLQIYRWQTSNTISILHRLTGVALSVGALLLAAWLVTAAYYPDAHAQLRGHLGQWYGLIALIGWSAAFYYHLAAGIRHLFWDTGRGFDLPVMNKTAWLVVIFTVIATGGTWFFIFSGLYFFHDVSGMPS